MLGIERFASSLRPVFSWPLLLQPFVLSIHLLGEVLWFVTAFAIVAVRMAVALVFRTLCFGGLIGRLAVAVPLWLVKLIA